jgi:hypothetical protein
MCEEYLSDNMLELLRTLIMAVLMLIVLGALFWGMREDTKRYLGGDK